MIGVPVTKLRKSEHPEVATLAKQLSSQWRALAKAAKPGTSDSSPPATATAAKPVPGAPAAAAASAALPVTAPPAISAAREQRRGLLAKRLSSVMKMDLGSPSVQHAATRMEAAVFRRHGGGNDHDLRQEYGKQVLTLWHAIGGNAKLATAIVSGAADMENLASSSERDLASDEFKAAIEKNMADAAAAVDQDWDDENLEKNLQAAGIDTSGKSEFQCPKCHKYKVDFRFFQTRSADEPMTCFLRCRLCRFRWRIYG